MIFFKDTTSQIGGNHLAGAHFAFTYNFGFVDADRTDFGANDDHTVVGDEKACWAQPVAVERQANDVAITKGECGRSIPRLDDGGVVLIKGAPGGIHVFDAFPCLRHQHGQSVANVAPAHHRQFQHVVEHRRVAAVGVDHVPGAGHACTQIGAHGHGFDAIPAFVVPR